MTTFNEAPTDLDQTNELIEQARQDGIAKGRKQITDKIWTTVVVIFAVLTGLAIGSLIVRAFHHEDKQSDRISELESDLQWLESDLRFYANNSDMSYEDKEFVCQASGKEYNHFSNTCEYPQPSETMPNKGGGGCYYDYEILLDGVCQPAENASAGTTVYTPTFPPPSPTTMPSAVTSSEDCAAAGGLWYPPSEFNSWRGACDFVK